MQVHRVHLAPDRVAERARVVLGVLREEVEEGLRIAQRGLAQVHEPVEVPVLDVLDLRVDVDREVEEVGDDDGRFGTAPARRCLQDVQPFDDHDVGAAQDDLVVGDDVVGEVRIHRRRDDRLPRLQLGEELQQPAHVVALGEPLAAHQAARFELGVRVQEPVGGDEVDARMVGPAHQQRLEDARDRALADGDAAREADDVRHVRVQLAEERLGHGVELTGRREPEVQQP